MWYLLVIQRKLFAKCWHNSGVCIQMLWFGIFRWQWHMKWQPTSNRWNMCAAAKMIVFHSFSVEANELQRYTHSNILDKERAVGLCFLCSFEKYSSGSFYICMYGMVWCAHTKQFVRQFLLFSFSLLPLLFFFFFWGIDLFWRSHFLHFNLQLEITFALHSSRTSQPRTINAMFTWMFPSLVSGLLYTIHACINGMACHASANRVKT